jgi:GRF zinc finger
MLGNISNDRDDKRFSPPLHSFTYFSCRWLPQGVRSASTSSQLCTACTALSVAQVHLLDLKISVAQVPGYPAELSVCPCCHPIWGEMFSFPLKRVDRIQNPNPMVDGAGRRQISLLDISYESETSNYAAAATGESYKPVGRGSSRGRGRGRGRAAGGRGGRSGNAEGPICSCGQAKVLLTTRKPGPNLGKQFYTCPNPQGSQCPNNFVWAN